MATPFKRCLSCCESDVTVVRGVCAECRIDRERERERVEGARFEQTKADENFFRLSPAALRAASFA